MAIIREYDEERDSQATGRLIADTYCRFYPHHLSPDELPQYLGPFQYAHSIDKAHQTEIAKTIEAPFVLVAEAVGEIVGVLRGRSDRLHSLFVREDHHRQGIGRQLMSALEASCLERGSHQMKLTSTIYAVPFYTSLGYKHSTGVRRMRNFDGRGLPYQPMKKILAIVTA